MTQQTLIALDRTEVELLQNFIWYVDNSIAQFGDDARVLKFEYDGETGSFKTTTSESKNKKVGWSSRLRLSLESWGYGQIERLEGYNQERVVTSMTVKFEDGKFGVMLSVTDSNTETAGPVNSQDSTDGVS